MKILKWDYERGQINPAKKAQYDKMLEEQKVITAKLEELNK